VIGDIVIKAVSTHTAEKAHGRSLVHPLF